MATRKSDVVAPAQPMPALQTALDRFADRVNANLPAIRDACDKAFVAGENKGFDEQLAASKAFGIDYDTLAIWAPVDARVQDNPEENIMRNLHALSEPQSSPLALIAMKRDLALVSNASEPSTVEHVRIQRKKGILPKRDSSKTPAQGMEDIKAALAATNDKARKAELNALVEAANNVDAIVVLCREANKAETATTRFRKRLYLHHVAPLMAAGNVPNADYEAACGVAVRAHKDFARLVRDNKQERTAARVKAMIESAVTDWIGTTYGTKDKVQLTNAEIGAGALKAIFTNARKAAKMGAIPTTALNGILSWLTAPADKGGAEAIDPEDEAADKRAQAAADRKAAKDAAKATAGKGAAKPSSTAGKKKAKSTGPLKPRKPRGVPPASTTGTVTTSTDDTDDVLGDLKS